MESALRLDLVSLLHVARQMVAVAGGGEGAGNGYEYDLAALEEIVRGLGHRPVRVMTRNVTWGRRSPPE